MGMVSSLLGSLEGPTSPSLCHACTHLPRHGYTGGPVAPVYNQPSSSCRNFTHPLPHMTAQNICAVLHAARERASLAQFRPEDAYFPSLLRADAWIVHKHHWRLPGSLGSLGSITAGKSACSFLWATPHECRIKSPLLEKYHTEC